MHRNSNGEDMTAVQLANNWKKSHVQIRKRSELSATINRNNGNNNNIEYQSNGRFQSKQKYLQRSRNPLQSFILSEKALHPKKKAINVRKGIETMQPRLNNNNDNGSNNNNNNNSRHESHFTVVNVTTEAYACTTSGTANVKCHLHQTKEVLMILS